MEDVVVTSGIGFPPILYLFIAIIVIAAIAFGIWKIKRLFTRPEMYGLSREEIMERWGMIRKTGTQGIMGAKLAIMEADTLLDSALKSMTMPGTTLGERLKVACYKYPKLRNVWWAHKLRNQLVHESSFQIGQRQANQALDEYEKALKTLNLL
jgi:hypothetical protein